MAWPYDDDLIGKIRNSINNGFSIGMGGKDRLSLADLANLQANIDPANASDILGRAADDIGFGAGGSKYTLAAMNKLGNGVPGLDPMERLKMERAGVEGFATGGIIPGPVNPEPVDDTVIAAKQGEYVIPADIVQFLGQKTFDDMVVKARQRMTGQEGAPPRGAKKGYAQGGLVLDPEKRPEYTQPFTSLSDVMVNKSNREYIPNGEQIGATIDNGSNILPAYNIHDNKLASLGAPLTSSQADALHKSWGIKPLDQLTAADKQYMANMPISIGATEGTYGNLADVTKRALADSVDKQNAGMGLMTRDNPQAEAARLAFRGGLSKTDALESNAQLRAMTQQALENQREDSRWKLSMAMQDRQDARQARGLAASLERSGLSDAKGDRRYETGLRKEFEGAKIVKEYDTARNQMARIESGLQEIQRDPKNAKNYIALDQSLVMLFNKMLDPDSVVREGEYARTIQNSPLLSRVRGKLEQVASGGAGFTGQERQAIVNMARQFSREAKGLYDNHADEYRRIAGETGASPDRVVIRRTPRGNAPGAPMGEGNTVGDLINKHTQR